MPVLWGKYSYYCGYITGEINEDREVIYFAQGHTAGNLPVRIWTQAVCPQKPPLTGFFSLFIKIHPFSEPTFRIF